MNRYVLVTPSTYGFLRLGIVLTVPTGPENSLREILYPSFQSKLRCFKYLYSLLLGNETKQFHSDARRPEIGNKVSHQ